jgi:hypothetical protein
MLVTLIQAFNHTNPWEALVVCLHSFNLKTLTKFAVQGGLGLYKPRKPSNFVPDYHTSKFPIPQTRMDTRIQPLLHRTYVNCYKKAPLCAAVHRIPPQTFKLKTHPISEGLPHVFARITPLVTPTIIVVYCLPHQPKDYYDSCRYYPRNAPSCRTHAVNHHRRASSRSPKTQ